MHLVEAPVVIEKLQRGVWLLGLPGGCLEVEELLLELAGLVRRQAMLGRFVLSRIWGRMTVQWL